MEVKEDGEPAAPVGPEEESGGRWNSRSKRLIKKKITLVYLLKVICSSQETCIDWLKNRGLIPKIMFCSGCSRKMKFEAQESVLDGYIWICKDCKMEPPQYPTRHGSWLENRDASLVDILLFTYLWSHGFTEAQIVKETNLEVDLIRQWDKTYSDICDALRRKDSPVDEDDCSAEDVLKISSKESPVAVWRKKNKYKDPFLEFLKDADSL